MSVTDDIKAKLDIVAYIGQYVSLKKAGKSYKGCCPFHNEKTPSFVVNPDTQTFKCFGCGEGGDLFSFAIKRHGWTFSEALQELGKQAGVEVRRQSPAQKAQSEQLDHLRGLLQTAADVYHQHLLNGESPDAVATRRYVREKRGLTDATITRFQIGYAPPGWTNLIEHLKELGYTEDHLLQAGVAKRNEQGRVYDVFRNRLMIPIRDERGRVVGFGARALAPDDNPKYLNSPQSPLFDKSKILFGLDIAKTLIRSSETAIIVEGYMDAIQAHQAGFANVVAQMGTALTEMQLKLLAPRLAKKIILALDSDAAGQNATRRSLEVARQALQGDYSGRLSVDMRILQIPGAKDPDDFLRESPDQWQGLVENATPAADFVIAMETAGLASNASFQEREAVARRLLPILAASEDALYTKDNLQKLALKLRIAERDLMTWAQEQRKIEIAKPPRSVATPSERGSGETAPEPPPLDYDALVSPLDMVGQPVSEVVVHSSANRNGYEVEAYCLRVLLHQPDLFYQINRTLRSLAGDDPNLRRGPLADLGEGDFVHSDYRELIQALKTALAQDELEPLDFLKQVLDPALLQSLDALMVDDFSDVLNRTRHRLVGELNAYWKHHERYTIPSVDLSAEVIQRALHLRIQRLQREREELRFLQMEVDENAPDYGQQIVWSMQAKRLLEAELHRQRGFG